MRDQLEGGLADADVIARVVADAHTVAVVGLSANPSRASHSVAAYLQQHGYRVIPVNPNEVEVLGERSYPSLLDIGEPVDIVDVFRRPEVLVPIARDAVSIGARALWGQFGVVSLQAAQIAREGGLEVVMDRCLKVEHAHLSQRPSDR
ncbi:MAG: CoA-binding protein [Solirubrobacteraceae bacterium]